ncbi:MAG TPA: hypothetical protein VEF55_01510 [Candidatus Binatia bacterium]|nr:hypothetical protein [Candidatus Binatia bacterium]
MRVKQILAAVAAMATFAGSANAVEPVSYELRLRGYVPVICRASVGASVAAIERGVVALGTLNEFCNNANGYEVWVDYSPQLSGAILMVDGRAVRLAGAQSSVKVSASMHAAMQTRQLALHLQGRRPEGSISFRVVAL